MSIDKAVVAIVTTILIISSGVVAESGKKYRSVIAEPTEGDYVEFDVDLSGMFQAFIDDPEMEVKDVENNIRPTFSMTYHGNSCINLPPSECSRTVISSAFNFTLIHDDESETYDDDTIMSMSMVITGEDAGGVGWIESTLTTDAWLNIAGEDWHLEMVEVETGDITYVGSAPSEFSVGDTWTLTTESDMITTSRERLNGGEWETETTEESWSNTTNYNAEVWGQSSSNPGIDTIKLSSQEIGSSAKDVEYYSEHGIPVKMETYNEDGDLEMIVTLKEYRYLKLCGSPEPFHGFSAICYGEPADNGGIMDSLPGFNAIAAVSMIGIATVFPRVSRD